MTKYLPTIGIECHVQLATKTKLFSEVDNDARDKEPNSCVSPVDYALPGMLPRLNGAAVKLAVRAGFAMNAAINLKSRFDRKHYFYPDSPKGYQITQFFSPIIGAGFVELPDGTKIRIEHAHLEGDAGKLSHFDTYSLVDLNRVDTPLIEIVSMPDIHSAAHARDYCKELWRLMTFSGVSFGDLYNGNMRFDVNISLAPEDSDHLGTRAEIKNLNSFRSVERAVEYEIKRQSKLLDSGEKVVQETRGWNDATGETTAQRSKEVAADYRYMPEPDLPPLNLSEDFVAVERAALPLLPADYRRLFRDSISPDTLEILLDYKDLMESLHSIAEALASASDLAAKLRRISNLFASVLLAEEKSVEMFNNLPSATQLIDLATMADNSELSSTAVKEVFLRFFDPDMREKSARIIAKELNLLQENDLAALEAIVDKVLSDPATSKAQAEFKAGQEKVLGFLVGQVMKASSGKANPSVAQKILREKLKA
ncbi:Asp-tRNA(Asn)/Glu-tRNA(Gln) amidotransferase subunit GatB [Candidatus Saccharibacteria bacterium]|nr:Asp-tRNA(Asn)/Glu-tRNA(Gln) amidotransferase subunit GatB [Candidatus Saccharibacteria bacterium]